MLFLIKSNTGIQASIDPFIIHHQYSCVITLNRPVCGYNNICLINIGRRDDLFESSNIKKYDTLLLVSNLQKCMRRKMNKECIATAYQLIKQDTMEFLKILPIILLEDTMYHKSFAYVIWLMLAYSKGYKLTYDDVNILLSAVLFGLEAQYRYNVGVDQAQEQQFNEYFIFPYIRHVFQEDTPFIEKIAYSLGNNKLPIYMNDSIKVKLDIFEDFEPRKHIIKYAIDFTSCPETLKIMNKQAMWWLWSSINVRNTLNKEHEKYEQEMRDKYATIFNQFKNRLITYAEHMVLLTTT
jgi:hypothetical protein